jgi:hypothetical protein
MNLIDGRLSGSAAFDAWSVKFIRVTNVAIDLLLSVVDAFWRLL